MNVRQDAQASGVERGVGHGTRRGRLERELGMVGEEGFHLGVVLLLLERAGAVHEQAARGDHGGGGMQERAIEARNRDIEQMRQMVGGGSAADQIAQAKSLLDSGAIDQAEYEKLKKQALA